MQLSRTLVETEPSKSTPPIVVERHGGGGGELLVGDYLNVDLAEATIFAEPGAFGSGATELLTACEGRGCHNDRG